MGRMLCMMVALLMLAGMAGAQPQANAQSPAGRGQGGRGRGMMSMTSRTMNLSEIRMRDVCILPDPASKTYYMVGPGFNSVRVYVSKDLKTWTGPKTIFTTPQGIWGDIQPVNIWAPEMHAYKGKYYLFLTFDTRHLLPEQWRNWERAGRVTRGSTILVSDSPSGPFKPFLNHSTPPPDMMTLDGTLWVEDGKPTMVFAHEWVQITNGSMEAIPLKGDLSEAAGEPFTLFHASEAPWSKTGKQFGNNVTDGPYLYKSKSGKLFMIWASGGTGGYTEGIAISDSGKLAGPWRQQAEPIYGKDGGHAMLFTTFEGQLMMVLHSPNGGGAQPRVFEMEDTGETLKVAREFTGQEPQAAMAQDGPAAPQARKADTAQEGPAARKSLIDYFLPMPIQRPLVSNVWGAPGVFPRDTGNGLEDVTMKQWCYWDGQIIKGTDGKYHMFASRWDQSRGHGGWGGSLAVHAVSDNLIGPYIDKGVCWPDSLGGRGHNVTGLVMPDGRYAVVVSETRPGEVFASKSLDGPWESLGKLTVEGQPNWRASNVSIMVRPDGNYMIVPRSGAIMISKSGITGPYVIQGPSIYPQVKDLPTLRNLEDPVVWFSGGLYHIVVNSWSNRKAFHLTSVDGINNWTYRGLAYDPTTNFLKYTDGTVNHWDKIERPGVLLDKGHVVAFTFAVLDVPKEQERGNDTHGSKVIVVPFDGEALDRDLQSAK